MHIQDIVLYVTTVLCVLTAAVYLYFQWCFLYWKKRGVPTVTPSFPFAHLTPTFLGKCNINDNLKNCYEILRRRGAKYGGLYFFNGPVFFPIDLDLIRDMLTTNYMHFPDRGAYQNETVPISLNLFTLKYHIWKPKRAKLTPLFTSLKLKNVYPFMTERARIAAEVVQNLEGNDFEMKDLAKRYTLDVVGNAILGLECNTLRKCTSVLEEMGSKIISHTVLQLIKILSTCDIRNPGNLSKLAFSNIEVNNFFRSVIEQALKHGSDVEFMQHFLKLHKENKMSLSEIYSELFILFTAGFETTSTLITFSIYELAKNQKLQDKLRNEILESIGNDASGFEYEKILSLPLLDKVIKESLRMYPPVTMLNRICVKDYTIPGTNTVVEKGTPVLMLLYGIHRDQEYFPEPEKFDPSRFDEGKEQVSFTYMPFGEGPRLCLGKRFGNVSGKLAVASLIANFKFTVSPKTMEPLQMAVFTEIPVFDVKGGIWLKAVKV